uniref:Uncharacterized protein n=1 Tax=Ornithorhynchus anatinus TaxID=9258 RepID=A0A6I8PH32_ORNAN
MGCASGKHVSTVQNEEEAQKGKNYQNGDVFGDEYRIKPVEEVKYMKNGAEDEQKVAVRNQENLLALSYRKGAKTRTLKPAFQAEGIQATVLGPAKLQVLNKDHQYLFWDNHLKNPFKKNMRRSRRLPSEEELEDGNLFRAFLQLLFNGWIFVLY